MSKSMPIAWHRECLKNMNDSLRRLYHLRAQANRDSLRLEAETSFLLDQITEAERRGKTEFDAERYLVKRAKKTDG